MTPNHRWNVGEITVLPNRFTSFPRQFFFKPQNSRDQDSQDNLMSHNCIICNDNVIKV